MPYIIRDASGKIIRASARPLMDSTMLPHNHPEVVAFLKDHQQSPEEVAEVLDELRRTDQEMVRSIEDIITVLLKKNVIKMSDLPKQVQERVFLRVKLRMMIDEIYEKASRSSP